MYPNVRAEFARAGLTLESVAKELGISVGTLSVKLQGKFNVSLNEAKKIKEIIKRKTGRDIPIEELFEEGE